MPTKSSQKALSSVWNISSYPDFPKIKRVNQYEIINLPSQIRILNKTDEDTQILDIQSSCWSYYYLGKDYRLNWVDLTHLDSWFLDVCKLFICERLSTLSPATVSQDFYLFKNAVFKIKNNFGLEDFLTISSSLYSTNNANGMITLIQFYRWGIRKGFAIFKYEILLILESLPKIKTTAFESIALNQNYVSKDDEAELLKYIDLKLAQKK